MTFESGTQLCNFCGNTVGYYTVECLGYLDEDHERIWYCQECQKQIRKRLDIKISQIVWNKLLDKQKDLLNRLDRKVSIDELLVSSISNVSKDCNSDYFTSLLQCRESFGENTVEIHLDKLSYLFALRKQVQYNKDTLIYKGAKEEGFKPPSKEELKISTDNLLKGIKETDIEISDIVNYDIFKGLDLLNDRSLGIISYIVFGDHYYDCFGCCIWNRGLYYGKEEEYIPKYSEVARHLFIEFNKMNRKDIPNFEFVVDIYKINESTISEWAQGIAHKPTFIEEKIITKDMFRERYDNGYQFDVEYGKLYKIKKLIVKDIINAKYTNMQKDECSFLDISDKYNVGCIQI